MNRRRFVGAHSFVLRRQQMVNLRYFEELHKKL